MSNEILDTKTIEDIAGGDQEYTSTLIEKATWTRAAINDLPDGNFLYVEPGGSKDSEGKTVPRGKRHFPYKGADGKIDLLHLRNAIARIPQSNAPGLTPEKKTALQNRARKMLENANKGLDADEMDQKDYAPYGVMTFDSLDEYRKGQEMLENVAELTGDYMRLFSNNVSALMDGMHGYMSVDGTAMTPDQFEGNIKALTTDFIARLKNDGEGDDMEKGKGIIRKAFDAIRGRKENHNKSGLMIYKDSDTGRYHWVARYSNKFRDVDNPPEIISDASHQRFVEHVDKGLAPYPDLWLWHEPSWVIGKSTWVSYDDAGFAMAAGYFYDYAEPLAEAMSQVKSIGVSHGMPTETIKRDKDDPTIIVEHYTKEISPLPPLFAANKLAELVAVVLPPEEEKTMSIPDTKKAVLQSEWGLSPQIFDAIEAKNKTDAEKAVSEGIEFKEAAPVEQVSTDVEAEVVNETTEPAESIAETAPETTAEPETPVAPETPVVEGEKGLDVKAIIEALSAVTQAVQTMSDRQAQLEKDNQEVRNALETILAQSPRASLGAMLIPHSVIGNPDTAIDGRTTLAKSKPAESEPVVAGTGIQFIDQMLRFGAAVKQQES